MCICIVARRSARGALNPRGSHWRRLQHKLVVRNETKPNYRAEAKARAVRKAHEREEERQLKDAETAAWWARVARELLPDAGGSDEEFRKIVKARDKLANALKKGAA